MNTNKFPVWDPTSRCIYNMFDVKDTPPPPWISCAVIVHKILQYKSKMYNSYGVNFYKKKISVRRGNFSKYFMKIIVFSQLYHLKSATIEVTYNIKNNFLLIYDIPHPPNNRLQRKIVRTFKYIMIKP